LRVLVPYGATLDQVAELVASKLLDYIESKKNQNSRFGSTRGQDIDKDFFHVILKGLADGIKNTIINLILIRWRTLHAKKISFFFYS
jgi:hypothetical protein